MTASQDRAPVDISLGLFDEDLLAACISCGFCLPACPTYKLTLDERSSPRGRITLMRAVDAGRLPIDDPTVREQSSYCLGCRACEPVCPAGVQYGALLEQWRDLTWSGPRTPPVAAALRAGVRMTPALAAAGRVRGAAHTTGRARGDGVQLMLGCVERSLFPGVSQAVARLLPGIEVPSGQGCCGALHAHSGGSSEGHRLAEKLGEALPGTILTTAGGCAAHLVTVLGRHRVRELSEHLVDVWSGDDAPALGEVRVDGRRARVALQDSCHLRNGLGVSAQPRDLVARVADYVELPSAGACCGGAGTYSLLRPDDAAAVVAPKLDEVESLGLDYLVVVNPVCQRQLVTALRRHGSRVRVLHLAELLALALPP
jgi:glycolate oxidase iron-sulfur subunit